MSEDALVNTGAVEWPSVDSAYFTVRRMQTKLHRWAGGDASRRFGDLFNLVYDPAFFDARMGTRVHQQGRPDRRDRPGQRGLD